MEKILIIGATSAIAEACARKFATEEKSLFLYGRDEKKLNEIGKDLLVRGAKKIFVGTFNAEEHLNQANEMIENAISKLNGFDTVVLAHGILPDQKKCEQSFTETKKVFEINCLSIVTYLTVLGEYFKKQHAGNIVVISSVAGDRIRKSNYIYGTSKGALSLFCDGLRSRLMENNINILTVKPGFVDTPMTAMIESKGLLWAKPKKIADDIIKGIENNKVIVYTPWFWKWIMLIINIIPQFVFKRLHL